MPKNTPRKTLPSFAVIKGECLGHKAYRGFGALRDLAAISKADIFDQEKNRFGTQRNLKLQHARKAYQYVTETKKAFYPEIILNIRDHSYVNFVQKGKQRSARFGILEFVKDPRTTNAVVVSRLDGNHRIWFADGREKGFDSVVRPVSFCFLALPDLEEELELFRTLTTIRWG